MDENLNGAPEAVTSICALTVGSLAARVKRMKGAGFPKLVDASQLPDTAETLKPDSV